MSGALKSKRLKNMSEDQLQRHRKTTLKSMRELRDTKVGPQCEGNIGKAETFGQERDTSKGMIVCLTMAELGECLGGYSLAAISRWVNSGRIPKPVTKTNRGNTNERTGVYTVEETEAIMSVLSEHQKVSFYFKGSHKKVIGEIFSAVGEAREKMKHG